MQETPANQKPLQMIPTYRQLELKITLMNTFPIIDGLAKICGHKGLMREAYPTKSCRKGLPKPGFLDSHPGNPVQAFCLTEGLCSQIFQLLFMLQKYCKTYI